MNYEDYNLINVANVVKEIANSINPKQLYLIDIRDDERIIELSIIMSVIKNLFDEEIHNVFTHPFIKDSESRMKELVEYFSNEISKQSIKIKQYNTFKSFVTDNIRKITEEDIKRANKGVNESGE